MSIGHPAIGPSRVDEPQAVEEYAEIMNRVAADRRPLIIRRNGTDIAAIVPLEHLEVLCEALAQLEVEKRAARIDWDRLVTTHRPPQEWFDGDEPKPF
jgi:prevent-host-death family protein